MCLHIESVTFCGFVFRFCIFNVLSVDICYLCWCMMSFVRFLDHSYVRKIFFLEDCCCNVIEGAARRVWCWEVICCLGPYSKDPHN